MGFRSEGLPEWWQWGRKRTTALRYEFCGKDTAYIAVEEPWKVRGGKLTREQKRKIRDKSKGVGDVDTLDLMELIQTRHSTRKFRQQPLEGYLLHQVVEAGRFAPSGGNNQSTRFLVIQDQAALNRLSDICVREFAAMKVGPETYSSLALAIRLSKKGTYRYDYHAPVLILTANKKGYGNCMADCACAVENMMLMAHGLNLGTCWVNQIHWLTDNPAMNAYLRELGMQEDEMVAAGMVLGYPDTEDCLPDRRIVERKGNPVVYVGDSYTARPVFYALARVVGPAEGEDGGEVVKEALRLEGDRAHILMAAANFVRERMITKKYINKLTRQRYDRPEYPMEAVQEVIYNALRHRDYSSNASGIPVTVTMYPDRLIVENPISADRARNFNLANFKHSGIQKVYRAMKKMRLYQPDFCCDERKFTVTLYNDAGKAALEKGMKK